MVIRVFKIEINDFLNYNFLILMKFDLCIRVGLAKILTRVKYVRLVCRCGIFYIFFHIFHKLSMKTESGQSVLFQIILK